MSGGFQSSARNDSLLPVSQKRETHEVYDTGHTFPRILEAISRPFGGSSNAASEQQRRPRGGSMYDSGVMSDPDDLDYGEELHSPRHSMGPGEAAGHAPVFTTSASSDANPALAPPPLPAAEDARMGCAHCHRLFRPSENGPGQCRRHSGRFAAPASASGYGRAGAKRRWTCCRKENERADGCQSGPHEEDARMTQILNTFNAVERDGYEELGDSSGSGLSAGKSDVALVDDDDDDDGAAARLVQALEAPVERNADGDIMHLLLRSDTLAGISLKYGVGVHDIKRRNRIASDRDLFMFAKLKIPQPAELNM
jgi:LysM domain